MKHRSSSTLMPTRRFRRAFRDASTASGSGGFLQSRSLPTNLQSLAGPTFRKRASNSLPLPNYLGSSGLVRLTAQSSLRVFCYDCDLVHIPCGMTDRCRFRDSESLRTHSLRRIPFHESTGAEPSQILFDSSLRLSRSPVLLLNSTIPRRLAGPPTNSLEQH